ncbi:MAG: stage III sporulation AC/AD family protein [Firmicutes bacterium]|nr:stage III sporulation AC/AD family protein [Bacillota bacterium]
MQITAVLLLASLLGVVLRRMGAEFSALLTLAALCMALVAVGAFVSPVLDYLRALGELGNLDSDLLQILFKAVGIGLVSQMAGLICADCGSAALGRGIQVVATVMILWLALPMLQQLAELIYTLMGEA